LKDFRIIAFTHRNTRLDDVGRFHLDPLNRHLTLSHLKKELGLDELLYLSTCNRVEFLFCSSEEITPEFSARFFHLFNSEWTNVEVQKAVDQALVFQGEDAIRHIFKVTSSLDSLVVGEREIISQVKDAYANSVKEAISGDSIRLLMRKVVETAKEIFTDTPIARNPVSVVSLAYRRLRGMNVKPDARFLIIGTGQTNTNMCKYLKKHGFRNFVLFNRSLKSAEILAKMLGGKPFPLSELENYQDGFDVLLTCTAAADHLISPALYQKLLNGETGKKIAIDLAIPYDIDPQVYKQFTVTPILVESLRQAADENLALRHEALQQCEDIIEKHIADFRLIYRQRQIEIAMREVPRKVKEIREHAMTNVFARDMESLDDDAREVVERMLTYLEKKYISVPMKLAREILLDQQG